MKTFRSLLLLAWLAFASTLSATTTNQLLTITAAWRYQTNNLDGVNWTATNYNHSAWLGSSNALFYIESSTLLAPKNTPLPPKAGGALPCNTYYFRTTFNLTNAAGVTSLGFSNLVDDGAVYYLNGVEVQRLYMADGVVTYTNLSSESHEADAWDNFTLTGNALTNLVTGTNTLAAEVHQTSSSSSDVVFGAAVTAFYASSTNVTRGPYLQRSSTNRIVIRWRTDVATHSRVD
ncbi:MAG: hypothetical protein RL380_102, partial [Verrucomicrobiota bacterium]